MTIYTVKNKKLEEIHEQPFKLEREIQTLFEANLSVIKLILDPVHGKQ